MINKLLCCIGPLIWMFLSFRLESPIDAPKFVFGGFYPQNLGAHRSDPKKALPCVERRVLSPRSLVQIWRTVRPVALIWQRKQKKKKSGKLAIRPDHSRRRIEVKVCMPGGLRCVVLYISSFIKISPVFLPLCVVENRPFPLLWQLAYTTVCSLLPYKPWLLKRLVPAQFHSLVQFLCSSAKRAGQFFCSFVANLLLYLCEKNYRNITWFDFSFFLSPLGWHTLPSHASAEACLTGWPNAQPQWTD